MKTKRRQWIAAVVLLAACSTTQPAPQPQQTATPRNAESQRLHDEIARMDAAMSNAYKAHDLGTLMSLFDDQVEFYHDTGGLLGRNDLSAGFKSNFDQNNGIRRELIPGSLEVYPIHNYGAIEVGAHRFCHDENGHQECGTFQFVHVWQQKDGQWKVTRVISYGH